MRPIAVRAALLIMACMAATGCASQGESEAAGGLGSEAEGGVAPDDAGCLPDPDRAMCWPAPGRDVACCAAMAQAVRLGERKCQDANNGFIGCYTGSICGAIPEHAKCYSRIERGVTVVYPATHGWSASFVKEQGFSLCASDLDYDPMEWWLPPCP